MSPRLAGASLLVLLSIGVDARQAPRPLAEALVASVRPALTFPDARPDGTAPDASPTPVWTVRWPADGTARVEVVANPLNPGNRARALQVEEEIQKSARQSQDRSQADYEQALRDFARIGKVGAIHEVSLDDEGLAGERYDAESQLSIEAIEVSGDHRFEVGTSRPPEVFPGSDGVAAVIRVAANEYDDRRDGADALRRYCAEQAWVLLGSLTPRVDFRRDGSKAVLTIPAPPAGAGRPVIVALRGNVELVDRVLQNATWAPLRAYAR